MTLKQIRKYEMFVRVCDFGTAHRDRFPESSVGGQAFGVVGGAVAQLSEHAVSKMAAAREGRKAKAAARQALVDRLDAIGRTARAVGQEVPGFADPFAWARRRHPDQALVTIGRLFVRDVVAVKDHFIAHGLPPTFVDDLGGIVNRFEQALRNLALGKTEQTAAQAGIEAAFAAGFTAVRKLDVVVLNQLKDDPVAIAVWRRDRRVEGSHRTRSVAPAPAPPQDPEADLKVAS